MVLRVARDPGKGYLTGIETSRFKTFKENKLEFRIFAETSSSETRIVFVRISINEENDRIQTNIEQQWKHGRYDTYKHGNLGSPIVSKSLKFFFLIHIHTVHEMTAFTH